MKDSLPTAEEASDALFCCIKNSYISMEDAIMKSHYAKLKDEEERLEAKLSIVKGRIEQCETYKPPSYVQITEEEYRELNRKEKITEEFIHDFYKNG